MFKFLASVCTWLWQLLIFRAERLRGSDRRCVGGNNGGGDVSSNETEEEEVFSDEDEQEAGQDYTKGNIIGYRLIDR